MLSWSHSSTWIDMVVELLTCDLVPFPIWWTIWFFETLRTIVFVFGFRFCYSWRKRSGIQEQCWGAGLEPSFGGAKPKSSSLSSKVLLGFPLIYLHCLLRGSRPQHPWRDVFFPNIALSMQLNPFPRFYSSLSSYFYVFLIVSNYPFCLIIVDQILYL